MKEREDTTPIYTSQNIENTNSNEDNIEEIPGPGGVCMAKSEVLDVLRLRCKLFGHDWEMINNPGISDEARYMCAGCFKQKTEDLGTTGEDSHA